MTKSAALFPIRELARRTGVNPSTLRAWENRHGLLDPTRTESGHRLYGEADVRRVERLRELLAQGLGLPEVAARLDRAAAPSAAPPLPVAPAWQGYLAEALRALEDFSSEHLDRLYSEACALYPIHLVTRNLLLPMLELLGQRWDRRATGIAEEHFFSAWLRNKLGARLHHSPGARRGRPLILACLPGERHEIGLLLFALAATERGHRVVYLGADMPIGEIVHISRATLAQAIVLAGRDAAAGTAALAALRRLAGEAGIPICVGSHVSVGLRAELLAAGARPLGDDIEAGLDHLEAVLASTAKARRRR